ncbi:MAG TPA: DUF2723 domain-containing protein [Chthoniobacterales bacterium]|jgi:hypothetical protein|nr:DUF2723 domain-containing protein [Chthoniobacterales bacterium]
MSILADNNSKPWIGAAAVTIAAGVLYFLTAARDIVVGDTPELITAAATLGVPHPSGYPLFTMLGHLFSLLPLGSIPFRINLLSVVCDSLAVGAVYLIAHRLTKSQLASALAALLLAVNPIFWEWSLAAEVFPLNNLLAAVLILLLITWHEQPEHYWLLIAASFFFGLALTNHLTIVLLGPAFCFVLWQRRSHLFSNPALLVIAAVVFAIGLLPYAYVPWASSHHPVYNWGNVSSFSDLVGLVTRRSYGTGKLVSTPGYTGGPAWPRLLALTVSFGSVTGLLIIIGAIRAFRRARWFFWFTVLAFVFAGPLFIWITNLNLAAAPSALFILQRFFLLSQVVLAPLVAFGVVALAEFVAGSANIRSALAVQIVSATSLASVVISVTSNYRHLDLSRNFIARQFAKDIYDSAPANSILLVTGDGLVFPSMYLQKVEHAGPDVTLLPIPLLLGKWYVRQFREAHPDIAIPFEQYDPGINNLKALVAANQGRTFCIAGTAGNDRSLTEDYFPYQQGLLVTIQPKTRQMPLEVLLKENEQLLARVHPPPASSVRMNTFEADILNTYTYPPFSIGASCELVGLKPEASVWYQRALAINPNFRPAREALARLEH